MRAIIIGAGIAGLAAALRLSQIGWDSLIIERAPTRRSGGYAVTFGGLGYDAAERMGILPDLLQRAFVTEEIVYHKPNGQRRFSLGREIIAATMGPRTMNILRGDIETVLYDTVRDSAEIRFATTITAVDQDTRAVHATLSDGTVEHADLLIGADGLHSATRALVFGPEEDYLLDLGHRVAVYMLDRRPASIAPGTAGTLSAGGRTVAVISAGDDRNVAFFGYRTERGARHDDRGDDRGDDPATVLPQVYGDLGWVIPEVLASMARTDSVYFDTISQVVAPPGAATAWSCSATPPGASPCSPATAPPWPSAAPTGSAPNWNATPATSAPPWPPGRRHYGPRWRRSRNSAAGSKASTPPPTRCCCG
ncbi:FAD-dependent monooxygenase [Nonomuraea turcica]|uniref:FAD-dependent monooxygenase n=1 Tax=Nonomuraea sp. G32 TaxID=3067274 RepID=UPI00273CBC60|nr:FAD-dependent monooxygenase [Nonomuraea sp. G32]MDP4510557.1 FAD-dependent monooxygenase [Nonomuraea sp. G32]